MLNNDNNKTESETETETTINQINSFHTLKIELLKIKEY